MQFVAISDRLLRPDPSSRALVQFPSAILGYRYLSEASNPLLHPHTPVPRTHQRSTIPLEERTMGWQKTFTLSRRAKGCHLVTDEVVRNIQDGLNDVKVLFFAFYPPSRHVSISKCLNLLGRDVISFHVRCSSNFVGRFD